VSNRKANPANERNAVSGAPAGLDQLDPLLQHRSRLGAMVLLGDADAISFTRLKTLLDETDGNLGAQLRKLEDAGYITVEKNFVDRKPVSWYALTSMGRQKLKAHLQAMELLFKSARL
jgi:DNA-binding MarR family transcriptional regulator